MIWDGTWTEWLRNRILARHGLIDPPSLAEIERSQWSETFERMMRNRLMLGFFRYGGMHDPAARRYDNIRSAIARLELYLKDGNLEHLIDVANLCLLEFVKGPKGIGSHPNPSLRPIDDGIHTPIVDDSSRYPTSQR
jgi:hypothetical protein